MTSSSQVETWSSDPTIAVKTLSDHCRGDRTARRNILTTATRLQTLLAEPTDFIQTLARQNQLLACLKWLGEFQVLACIPLSGSIPIKEVADLAGVSETQLCRVVRMTATDGFLIELQPGHVAHTPLSAPFVTNLSFLDATMFLAETAAPASLQMATATQRNGNLQIPSDSAYSIAFNASQPFHSACGERTRLRRQWSAYRRCAGDVNDSVTELLARLNWRSLGSACIVDVCAHSTEAAMTLAETHPALRFVVQIDQSSQNGNSRVDAGKAHSYGGRITVQQRTPAAPQAVKDAAVYILRLPTPSTSLPAQILAELNTHLPVLRANAGATFILAPPLLPEPGTVDTTIEAMVRLRDLARLQLTNEGELEVDELIEMVRSVQDGRGRLMVVNKLRCRNGATVALQIKYEAHADDPFTAQSTAV